MRNQTITGEEIKVKANYSERTFTIRKYDEKGKVYAKYRTIPLSRDEFEEMEFDTANDWQNFLRSCSGDYYRVK